VGKKDPNDVIYLMNKIETHLGNYERFVHKPYSIIIIQFITTIHSSRDGFLSFIWQKR